MKELELHEQMEMFVLDEMRKIKALDHLIFGGGTMLRLCHDLPRFSVDLDFYLRKERKLFLPLAKEFTDRLRSLGAEITDQHEKHFSFLWEIRMTGYPRRLKIEIRKGGDESQTTELNIAHSQYSDLQVRLRTLTLSQMWINKVHTLLDRNEIRDAYDLEFLTRRRSGDFLNLPRDKLAEILKKVNGFSIQDFKAKLGPVLFPQERKIVMSNRFSYLKSKITAAAD